jgi:hypothetical protein
MVRPNTRKYSFARSVSKSIFFEQPMGRIGTITEVQQTGSEFLWRAKSAVKFGHFVNTPLLKTSDQTLSVDLFRQSFRPGKVNRSLENFRAPDRGALSRSNPNGIASSSPRLPSLRGYLGLRIEPNSTATRLRRMSRDEQERNGRNPVGVVIFFVPLPRIARASQPWALGRNPVGNLAGQACPRRHEINLGCSRRRHPLSNFAMDSRR